MSDFRGVLATWFRSLDYGNVPSWLTAFIATLALATAVWAARAAWKQVEHLNEAKVQEQASKVAAWLTVSPNEDGEPEVFVRYTNASSLPVYELEIIHASLRRGALLFLAEPTNDGIATVLFPRLTKIAQDEYRKWLEEYGPTVGYQNATETIKESRVLVRFTDTRNIAWQRELNGVLRKKGTRSDEEPFYEPGCDELEEIDPDLWKAGFTE